MEPRPTTCPHCNAQLTLRKPELIGAKVTCPKCKTPFVADIDDDLSDLDPPNLEYGLAEDKTQPEPAPVPPPPPPPARNPGKERTKPPSGKDPGNAPTKAKSGKNRKGKPGKKPKKKVRLTERLQKLWPLILLILAVGAIGGYFANGFLLERERQRLVKEGRLDSGFAISSWADLRSKSRGFGDYRSEDAEEETSAEPAADAPAATPTKSNAAPDSPTTSEVAANNTPSESNEQASAQQPVGPAQMPDLKHHRLDLSFLPPRPELVLAVRVGELWQAPLVKNVLIALGPKAQTSLDQMRAKFGMGPEHIESVTVGVTGLEAMVTQGMALAETAQAGGAGPEGDAAAPRQDGASESNTIIVLRTYEEFDQEALLAAMPHGEPVELANTSYYPLTDAGAGEPMFLHFAEPKTLIVASESEVKRAIQSGKREVRLPRPLQSFNANYHFVLVAPASQESHWLESAGESASPLAALGLTPELVQKIAVIGLSVDANQGLVAELKLQCKNQAGAAEISQVLSQAADQMKQSMPQGESPPDAAPLGDVATQIMRSLSTQQNGAAVTMTVAVPPSAFDPQNLATAMAPLMMMSSGGLAGNLLAGQGLQAGRLDPVDPEAPGTASDEEPIAAREPREGPPRILVDATKGTAAWWRPQSGPRFDPKQPYRGAQVVEYFEEQGWPVRALGEDDDVAAALEETDIAIRIGDTYPHTPAEVRAYDRFVRSGGSLLLLAKDRPDNREDPLAEVFGIRFAGQIISGRITAWDKEHPLSRRLSDVLFAFASEVVEWPESATILGQSEGQGGETPLFGVLEHGYGTVVFSSSESFLVDVPQPLTERVFALLSGELKENESLQGASVLTAARIDRDFEIKGDLTQAPWESATPVRIERATKSGEVHKELATTVRAIWSDEYLYLGFEAPFREMATAGRSNTQREQRGLEEKDMVGALISGASRRVSDFYEFQLTPQGEWSDFKFTDSGDDSDFYWNSGFEKVAQVDQQNKVWTAVMRIPLAQVSPVTPEAGTRWRINLFRTDPASDALLAWNPTRSDNIYVGRKFGILVFEE